jgi:hypothetical protein
MRVNPFHTIIIPATIAFIVVSFLSHAQSPSMIEVGKFFIEKKEDGLPTDWKPLTFKKIEQHTVYSLVRDEDTVVVRAVAEASASGLIREIKINPKEYPIIQWRWKVENILKKGDVHQKAGDDYPARVYITFEYDPSRLGFFEKAKYEFIKLAYGQYPPIAAINYIWESNAPQGTIVPNPYTDRAMMIVVESGPTKLRQWVNEERNLYEDFKNAFGYEPPMISGVAIMTDTDLRVREPLPIMETSFLKRVERRMNNFILAHEGMIRFLLFIGVLVLMAIWEKLSPRRPLNTAKSNRWFSNLGLIFINTLSLRLLLPIQRVRRIVTGDHCFGCTAGSGFSCGGTLV